VTNASRTQLLKLKTLDWDEKLLAAFAIPRAVLPAVRSSSEVYGEASLGTIAGVPISGILGDQQAALVGQACFRPRRSEEYVRDRLLSVDEYGERLRLLRTSGCSRRLPTNLRRDRSLRSRSGVAISGALVQWLRDNLGLIQKSSDVEALARTVKDNGGVYFVPAFSGLYAPIGRRMRGVIAGLTRYANKGTSHGRSWKRRHFRRAKSWKPWKRIQKSGSKACAWMGEW